MDRSQVQCSLHTPSPFFQNHRDQLLPEWQWPVRSLLLVLLRAQLPLLEKTALTEAEKQRLRQQFLALVQPVAHQLEQSGYAAEVFDPRTGLPRRSQPGILPLDHIAVARVVLGYPTCEQGGCLVMEHPDWGTSVYPGILVSSAQPQVMGTVVDHFFGNTTTLVPPPIV